MTSNNCVVAVGTPDTVSPGVQFCALADFAGARMVYINLEPMLPPNPTFHGVRLGRSEDLVPRILGVG